MSSVFFLFALTFVALLVYISYRYGSVYHTWMMIPKDDQREIEQAHRDYHLRNSTHGKNIQKGSLLYRKGLVSQTGLAIYQNGIYGKFCIGNHGKYRFKSIDEISAIFLSEAENPMVSRSNWIAKKSWRFLQIETVDYQVFSVDSRYHDLDEIIHHLKKQMGDRWDELYSEEHDIIGILTCGTIGWHTYLRKKNRTL